MKQGYTKYQCNEANKAKQYAGTKYSKYSPDKICVQSSRNGKCPYLIIVTTATTGGGVPFSSRRTFSTENVKWTVHSVRPRPSQKCGPPPFLMPCCIGCSEINKINRHLICHRSPHLGKKDLSQKRL